MRRILPSAHGDIIGEFSNDNFEELYAACMSVGDVYYFDPTNGDDNNSGEMGAPVENLETGYDLLRDGRNDVLVYIPGATPVILEEGFEWAKSYAHLLGASTPVPWSPRARIFLKAGTAGETFLFKLSGTGCRIQNLLTFLGVDDNTAAYAFVLEGHRNHLKNVHAAGIGHATMDVAGAGSMLIDGGSENLIEDSVIGLDTIGRAQNSCELMFDGAASRNTFKRTLFDAYITNAGHPHVKIADAQGIDRLQRFIACHFVADSENRATALTSVFSIPAGISQGMIDLDADCHVSSWGTAAAWDSNSRGIISSAMVAPAATAGGGKSTHV